MLKKIIIKLIHFYQISISPDHGVHKNIPFYGCKFHPSCSDYALQSLQKKSLLVAFPKIIWRIIRCHPWSSGGYDPVETPQAKSTQTRPH
jgi:putative membrane protein insertion efficiency factor